MTLSERLAEYIAACFTGLWVQSHEHADALTEIAGLTVPINFSFCVLPSA